MSELNLGAKLTALRLEKGVTQDEVANALDISNKTVSKWENGSSSPDIERLVRIAEYFGVSSDFLLGLENTNVKISELIDREFDGLNRCDAVLKMFDLSNNIFNSTFKRMGYCSDEKETVPEIVRGAPRNIISNEYLYQMDVNSEYLNMSCSLFRNKLNFAWLENDNNIRCITELLKFLSNELTVKICKLLHSEDFPENFTAKYLADKIDADEASVADLLEYACGIELCDKQTAHLRDGDTIIYSSRGHGRILMILSVAYEHMCGINAHDHFYGGTSKMIGGANK